MKRKSTPVSIRIWRFISKGTDNECWLWTGGRSKTSKYPVFAGTSAHRCLWKSLYGEIPRNIVVCHTCDNRLCMNPSHMFIGTQMDNVQDCKAKGRMFLKPEHKMTVGSMNGRSELVESDVLAIIERLKSGESPAKISNDYPVGRDAIYDIKRGKNWRHVTGGSRICR